MTNSSDQPQPPEQNPGNPQQPPGPPYAQTGYYPPQQQPPKKKHTLRNVLLVLALLFVLAVGGCFALIGGVANEVSKEQSKTHTVVYKVTGTGTSKADITYTVDGSGTTEDRNGEPLPFTKTIKLKGTFNSLDVFATNGLAKGSVTCTITVDGKLKKKATSHGQFATASCNGFN